MNIKQMCKRQDEILAIIDAKLTKKERELLTEAFRLEHDLTLEENQ
jgi:hypothetical protein